MLTMFVNIQIKLENQYLARKEMQQKEIDELKRELERKAATHQKLSTALADLRSANDQLQVNI